MSHASTRSRSGYLLKAMVSESPSNVQPAQQCLFLRLPIELRYMIYRFSLRTHLRERRHDPPALVRAVYEENLSDVWTDQPLPLLRLNKQISQAVCYLMHSGSFSSFPAVLRITGQGIALDSFGLTACITQGIHGDLSKISHLIVEVWPPRSDRPIDMLYIWDHLRRLRNRLRKCAMIRKLSLDFLDNELFTWATEVARRAPCDFYPSSRARFSDRSIEDPPYDDWKDCLDLFKTLTNVQTVTMAIPKSFPCDTEHLYLQHHAVCVMQIMEGVKPPLKGLTFRENLDWWSLEKDHKRYTARNALCKLRDLTNRGKDKICERQYDRLVTPWPYFESLTRWEDPKFEGKWFYARQHDDSDCVDCADASHTSFDLNAKMRIEPDFFTRFDADDYSDSHTIPNSHDRSNNGSDGTPDDVSHDDADDDTDDDSIVEAGFEAATDSDIDQDTDSDTDMDNEHET